MIHITFTHFLWIDFSYWPQVIAEVPGRVLKGERKGDSMITWQCHSWTNVCLITKKQKI